jgi:hypothetical protein
MHVRPRSRTMNNTIFTNWAARTLHDPASIARSRFRIQNISAEHDHIRYVRRCRTPSELCQLYQANRIAATGWLDTTIAVYDRSRCGDHVTPLRRDDPLRFPPKVALKMSLHGAHASKSDLPMQSFRYTKPLQTQLWARRNLPRTKAEPALEPPRQKRNNLPRPT